MEKPAIIFTHKGMRRYLNCAIKNAKMSNPESKVILLGDESNVCVEKKGVNHYYINDYFTSALEFEKKYIYQSTNTYEFELFCFQRWFVLKDFVEKNNISHFIACDSDVLIYDDLSKYYDYSKWQSDFLNVVDRNGPQCVYFTKESIKNFCDYITKQYTDKACTERLNKRWQAFVDKKWSGGNCDMTMFSNYNEDFPDKFFNLYGIANMKTQRVFFYDTSNYESDNKDLFLHIKDRNMIIAKMQFKDKIPYLVGTDGNMYKSPAIHFQGGYKSLMCKYSYAGALSKFYDLLHYWLKNTLKSCFRLVLKRKK